jgi:hypothetical protein
VGRLLIASVVVWGEAVESSSVEKVSRAIYTEEEKKWQNLLHEDAGEK